jgi:hypothetical protein
MPPCNLTDTTWYLTCERCFPGMAIRVTAACRTLPVPAKSILVLRWTFRRDDEAVVCELGLNSDDSAYELRVNPSWNPPGGAIELFDDAISAFNRHAALERALVNEGWLLEGFESTQVAR